jgi:hypothetical protein
MANEKDDGKIDGDVRMIVKTDAVTEEHPNNGEVRTGKTKGMNARDFDLVCEKADEIRAALAGA